MEGGGWWIQPEASSSRVGTAPPPCPAPPIPDIFALSWRAPLMSRNLSCATSREALIIPSSSPCLLPNSAILLSRPSSTLTNSTSRTVATVESILVSSSDNSAVLFWSLSHSALHSSTASVCAASLPRADAWIRDTASSTSVSLASPSAPAAPAPACRDAPRPPVEEEDDRCCLCCPPPSCAPSRIPWISRSSAAIPSRSLCLEKSGFRIQESGFGASIRTCHFSIRGSACGVMPRIT